MKLSRIRQTAAALLVLSGFATANADLPQKASDVIEIIDKVNTTWQTNHPKHGRSFWDNAAYHTGNMEAYKLTGNKKYLDYSTEWAKHNQWKGAKGNDKSKWKYSYGESDDFVLFGDYQICFQTYADLYNISPSPEKIARAREVMEYEMSTPKNDYWWWADGLYMVMPVMTKLYNITGNQQYLDKLYEYWTFANSIMYDPETGLYYRDGKYVYPKHKSANGKKDFWARGDGWVLAALAKVIQDLPANAPHRQEYVDRYLTMAKAVKAAQRPEGYWTRSMLDPEHAPGPETSGTAFFTYGLLWGINHGFLSEAEYLPTVTKAWDYLQNTALQEDGTVGYVQPIGEKAIPGQVVNQKSTANFGTGAYLLAACELARYIQNKENAANPKVITINAAKKGAKIPSTMYGLFFEDINYGADGGLYAEKVKNRSFEFPDPLMGWTSTGKVVVKNDGPFARNPKYVELQPAGHGHKHTSLTNEGYFGVSVEKDSLYKYTMYARVPDGKTSKVRVELIDEGADAESQVLASATIEVSGKGWKQYAADLKPYQTVVKGKLRVFLCKPETTVDLEHISLFPANNVFGLRADLVKKLKDLKPGVFRFPGGCIVEGTDLATRYQWKNTVGAPENRPLNENRWQYTFTHRFFPDYYQSYGLGFYEYFLLSELLGAEPLPVLNVGLACQYQNNDESAHVAVADLDPYIQDALDLIEFANGPVSSKWGALRAEMGHPEPFNLKFLAVGNEQWGEDYVKRLAPFVKALRKQHPEIKIIGSSGPNSEGRDFDYLWPEMKNLKVDLVDEHFYRPEDWFLSQGKRYDNYDRKGPKVFAGEYACHGRGNKRNHFDAALLEAAFMTGLERNADVVEMATYAPLFAHVEGWQWRPDLIWFDNLRSMPTASYYVQQMYGKNKGSMVVPTSMGKEPVAGLPGQDGLFASTAYDEATGEYIVKIANTGIYNQTVDLDFKGLKKKLFNSYSVETLHADHNAENKLDRQDMVKPVKNAVNIEPTANVKVTVPAKTFAVYRFK